ncbi:MAG: polyphosphate polymerase domain-containing protein [Hamadaea sp.]|nr:polyphosphate polymerase domain-containing protein [Hamadaea sp.]
MIAAELDALAPIALAELTERAPLLARVDRKYVLPLAEVPLLLAGLPGARVLEIDERREFGYRSVYFDTDELESYLAAARRRRRRYKLRVRDYLDTGTGFFEVKTREQRGVTVKRRIPYDDDPDRLSPAARLHAGSALSRAGIPDRERAFAPTLTTAYRRTTLFLPGSGSRLTIDTALTWHLPDGPQMSTLDRAIVETKTARAACEADRLLWSLGHRPTAISKYGTGLAALRPDLPSHRWQRVLRRHFPTTTDTTPAQESTTRRGH